MESRQKIIGMIIPDGTNQFFSSLAQHFQRELARFDYGLIVLNSDNTRARELHSIEILESLAVKGLIFISVGDNLHAYERLAKTEIPMLILDREIPVENADFLLPDNNHGIKLVVNHIVSRPFRKIGIIQGLMETEPGRIRHKKFVDYLCKKGIPEQDICVFKGDFQFASGRRAAEKIIAMKEQVRPDVIFASNDIMAVGFLQRIAESGLRVPTDISLIGYDDIPMACWIHPRLSTVSQDMNDLARNGVDLLLKRVNMVGERNIEQNVNIISPSLIVRESCL